MEEARAAAELLRSREPDLAAVEDALARLLAAGPAGAVAFCRAFGPKQLMRLSAGGNLSDRLSELTDEVLAACFLRCYNPLSVLCSTISLPMSPPIALCIHPYVFGCVRHSD